jgi:hypothetical protein
MDGASSSPRLIENDKWDCHLDAPYSWLCLITQLKQAGYVVHFPFTSPTHNYFIVLTGFRKSNNLP